MPRVSPTTLKAFIRADYDAAAPGWERYLGTYFRTAAERLVADLAPGPGDRCLDLACGSGLVARAFAARVGPSLVAAGDLSPLQVDHARGLLDAAGMADVTVRVLDAERLRLPAGSFERVGCGFGINHFPRPLVALRGVFRVLAPGGRAGFTVWGGRANPLHERFDELMLRVVPALDDLPDVAVEEALSRVAGQNSHPDRLANLMGRAGFVDVRHLPHRLTVDHQGPEWFVDVLLARSEHDLRRAGLDDPARRELRRALVAAFAAYPREAFVVRRRFDTLMGSRPDA